MSLIIEQFLIGTDNYAVLLHDRISGRTAAIDAMDSAPITAVLKANQWQLTDILVTHKHSDHIGGIADLKTFVLEQGLTWTDPGGRTFTVKKPELEEWIGSRADSGRLPPKGFPKKNSFTG